jgi:hypothetical protein
MIYKISPHPSLLKRGRKKTETSHSIMRKAKNSQFIPLSKGGEDDF